MDYLDIFEDPNSGWPVNNDIYLLAEYSNGEYRLLAKDPQYSYLIKAPTCQGQN